MLLFIVLYKFILKAYCLKFEKWILFRIFEIEIVFGNIGWFYLWLICQYIEVVPITINLVFIEVLLGFFKFYTLKVY